MKNRFDIALELAIALGYELGKHAVTWDIGRFMARKSVAYSYWKTRRILKKEVGYVLHRQDWNFFRFLLDNKFLECENAREQDKFSVVQFNLLERDIQLTFIKDVE